MRLSRIIRPERPLRAWIVRLCVGALVLPVVLTLTVVPSPLHTMAPLQTALVMIFNLGCLGLAAVGLAAMSRRGEIEFGGGQEQGESEGAVVNKHGDCVS